MDCASIVLWVYCNAIYAKCRSGSASTVQCTYTQSSACNPAKLNVLAHRSINNSLLYSIKVLMHMQQICIPAYTDCDLATISNEKRFDLRRWIHYDWLLYSTLTLASQGQTKRTRAGKAEISWWGWEENWIEAPLGENFFVPTKSWPLCEFVHPGR